MTQLVILEDAPIRLEMFKQELAHVQFKITDNVREFLAYVKEAEEAGTLRLVVMDHDLGQTKPGVNGENFDADGLSGTEAAMLLATSVPILIWSANQGGASRMVSTLKDKGIHAIWVPIWQGNELAAIFRKVFPHA